MSKNGAHVEVQPGALGEYSPMQRRHVRTALLIRRCEERLLDLFSQGKLNGTVHTCVGQEWSGVAIANALGPDDAIFTSHRGHGHYLARTGDVPGLFAEIMGKQAGASYGVGGSQHLHAAGYFSNGIQGGMAPVACGMALAQKLDGSGGITALFVGDGTLGEGTLYEALNIVSKWELPLLIVLENNGYAQSTATSTTTAGTVKGRAEAFGIEYRRASTWEWSDLIDTASDSAGDVRAAGRPILLEIDTYRLRPHSKGDDNRDPTEIERYREKDFLSMLESADDAEVASMLRDIEAEIDEAVAAAEASDTCAASFHGSRDDRPVVWQARGDSRERMVQLIHEGLDQMLARDERVVVFGEDVEAPYGGAFKVTRDLSDRYPNRVFNTPISEAAIVGVGTGLALCGYRPVVEIMFGDFMTLTLDQLLQHASKFCEMYGEKLDVPLVVRVPMGGRRGYGPTHSQSIEKHFLGIPNLEVVALNTRVAPTLVFERLQSVKRPTLVIENKILYTRFLENGSPAGYTVTVSDEMYPCVRIAPEGAAPEVTLVCYGGMLEEAEAAQRRAFDEFEIAVELIAPSQLHPLNIHPIADSVAVTKRLVTVEEGSRFAAWSGEVVSRLLEEDAAPAALRRIGYDGIIPSSKERELELLPDADDILAAIRAVYAM